MQFLGSGDAFGSGGRLQTCFLVTTSKGRFLIDCGASALIAMRRYGVDPNGVDRILLTHLHGDHFAGIPFFLLDAQLISKRSYALVVAGPPGLHPRITDLMEAMFPGSASVQRAFPVDFVELEPRRTYVLGDAAVSPYEVVHPSGNAALALRIECEGKVITYSGDTEWVPALIPAAQGADLFIAEAYFFDKRIKYHMDFQALAAHLKEIQAKRLIITHMSQDMLHRVDSLRCEWAEDGKIITL